MALRTKRADGIDLTDPVEQVSLAGWFAVSIFFLLIATTYAIYQEIWGMRPWKAIQSKFVVAAKAHYKKKLEAARAEVKALKAEAADDDEHPYAEAKEAAVEAAKQYEADQAKLAELEAERNAKNGELEQVRKDLAAVRGQYQAAVYQWEQAKTEEAKKHWHDALKSDEPEVQRLLAKMQALDAEVKALGQQIFEVGKTKSETERKLAAFEAEVTKFQGLIKGLDSFKIELRQNFVPELNYTVDRCISCHVGATQPDLEDIRSTLAEMPEFWGDLDKWDSLFASHSGEHLKIHPADEYGCYTCHAGDGPMASTVWESHGTHALHEYPLLVAPSGSSEKFGHMAEAGCNKCHMNEQQLPGAPLLSYGKQLFAEVGCIACHKAKGISPELDQVEDARKQLAKLESALVKVTGERATLPAIEESLDERTDALDEAKEERLSEFDDEMDGEDPEIVEPMRAAILAEFADQEGPLSEERSEFVHLSAELREQEVSLKDDIRVIRGRIAELEKNLKKHGPNLNNVKEKLRPDFIKEWLANPHAFNPETKMPRFWFLDDAATEEDRKILERQIEGVAAYLWQNADEPPAGYDRTGPRGDGTIAEGKRLFEQSGCLACHIGGGEPGKPIDTREGIEGTDVKKRMYGPTLVRTGEKARFDYLSRWIYDPKSLAPQTRMPNMRLTKRQSEAIAAYLVTQTEEKPDAAQWSNVPAYLEDPELAEEGFETIQRYGCYSCHAIKGTESFGRIGVELSSHGSKNLHLFDFGLIEPKVEHHMHPDEDHPLVTRYDYIHYKIQNPRSFEEGRYYVDANDDAHLRMPSFNITDEEAHALATFVVSLTEGEVPPEYIYETHGSNTKLAKGRNLTAKHNCISCHTIENQGGAIRQTVYADLLGDINYGPPHLFTQGRKTQPDWLFHFLKNPTYLRPKVKARMPYFALSDQEAQELVEYFAALDDQPYPYITRPPPHFTSERLARAQQLFDQLQCAKCHAAEGRPPPDPQAPSLDIAKHRLQPEWVEMWLKEPQMISPGTAMPSFGLADEDNRLLADYLRILGDRYQAKSGEYEFTVDRTQAGDE